MLAGPLTTPTQTITGTPTPTVTPTPTPTTTITSTPKQPGPKLSLDVKANGTAWRGPPSGGGKPIDISGGWGIVLSVNNVPCKFHISQTGVSLAMTGWCVGGGLSFTGSINDGTFSLQGTWEVIGAATFDGTATSDGNSMSGTFNNSVISGSFIGTRTKVESIGQCSMVVKESACDVAVGEQATVSVVYSELGLTDIDGDTMAGYRGFQVHLTFSTSWLTLKNRSNVDEVVWPDCDPATAVEVVQPGSYTAGCGMLMTQNESSYLGAIVEVDFTCTSAGAFEVALVPGEPLDSFVVDEDEVPVPPAKGASIWINCTIPTPTPEPTSTPTPDPSSDKDSDGCSNAEEAGPIAQFGGQRDPNYFWDFFDVYTHPSGEPLAWERNRTINILDILGVAGRFGPGPGPVSKAQALADALTPPVNTNGYHAAFDRGGIIGANNWDRAPADGTINIPHDILGVAAQFGHNCQGPL